ncbi:MAG: response regulator [Nitrososphaera sp.]|nr:response regulator [Nitrososphaera sp.]
MDEKNKKIVLIVDDEPRMCESLKDRFTDCNENVDCLYKFEADVALSVAECVQKVRAKSYDVIVLDVRLEEEEEGGLKANLGLALREESGPERPVRIIFTGYPSYKQCVEAIRHGAWDYIVKEDVDDTSMFQIVVDSALKRLQQLDLRRELEQQIAAEWLPQHFHELQAKYGGQLVALWHRPKVEVLADGVDAFELEAKLKDWRTQHAAWEQPYIVQIPRQN